MTHHTTARCDVHYFYRWHQHRDKWDNAPIIPWLVGVFVVQCQWAAVWVELWFSQSPASHQRPGGVNQREKFFFFKRSKETKAKFGEQRVVSVWTLAADRACSWCKWLMSVSCVAKSLWTVCSCCSLCCSFSFCRIRFLWRVKSTTGQLISSIRNVQLSYLMIPDVDVFGRTGFPFSTHSLSPSMFHTPSVGFLQFTADWRDVDLQLGLLLCHFLTQRVALLHLHRLLFNPQLQLMQHLLLNHKHTQKVLNHTAWTTKCTRLRKNVVGQRTKCAHNEVRHRDAAALPWSSIPNYRY